MITSIYIHIILCCHALQVEDAKKMAILIRALDFSAGLQKFTIVFITPLVRIVEFTSILQGETVKTGVCAFPLADAETKGNQLQ